MPTEKSEANFYFKFKLTFWLECCEGMMGKGSRQKGKEVAVSIQALKLRNLRYPSFYRHLLHIFNNITFYFLLFSI